MSSFVFNPFTGNLDRVGTSSSSPGSIDLSFFVDIFILTSAQIANKQVTLTTSPSDATKTILDGIGGVPQDYGIDFTVVGNVLSWNGLGLETILQVGEKIRVTYVI